MSKSIEGTIECPFYLEEGKGFIKCEGILNGTVSTHSFNTDKEKFVLIENDLPDNY